MALLLEKGKLLSSIFRCRIELVTYLIGGRHLAIATALFYSFAITLKMIGYLHISGNHSRNIASRTYSQLTNDASQKMLPERIAVNSYNRAMVLEVNMIDEKSCALLLLGLQMRPCSDQPEYFKDKSKICRLLTLFYFESTGINR